MNYIINTIKLIRSDDFYGAPESIEIAKGKNQIPKGFKQFFRKLKRTIHGN